MASLLALARAQIEEAKGYFTLSTRVHLVTLVTGIAALYTAFPWAYSLTVAATLAEAGAWLLKRKAARLQGIGEEARRRALLLDAFGTTAEPLDVADLQARFSRGASQSAKRFEDPNYYESTEPTGSSRLLRHLQESAFWSKHLYQATADRSRLLAIGIPVLIIIGSYFALPFLPSTAGPLFARALAFFVSFLFAFDEYGRSLAWSDAAALAERVDRRLESIKGDNLEPLLAVFADYNIASSLAPPIPTTVYQAENKRLNELWKQRKKPGIVG